MIRNNVKKVGQALGYKMSDVARGAGISIPALSRIWNDQTEKVSYETMDKLCTFFDVPVGDLWEHVPDEEMTPEDEEQLKKRIEGVAKYNAHRPHRKKAKEASQGD